MARIFSKLRLRVPVVALSSQTSVVRRMALYFGILPRPMRAPPTMDKLAPRVERLLLSEGLAAQGDTILIVGGTALGEPGRSNGIVMHRVGGAHPA